MKSELSSWFIDSDGISIVRLRFLYEGPFGWFEFMVVMLGDSLTIMFWELLLAGPEEQKKFRVVRNKVYIIISKLITYRTNIFLFRL